MQTKDEPVRAFEDREEPEKAFAVQPLDAVRLSMKRLRERIEEADDLAEKERLRRQWVQQARFIYGRPAGLVSKKTGRLKCSRIAPKVGRNDPCPCESGKKFKRCCLPWLDRV